jgi:apolipoprotein N-acyltransferase
MPYLIALLVVGLFIYSFIQLFIRSDPKTLAEIIRGAMPWLLAGFAVIAFILGRQIAGGLLLVVAIFYYLWAKNYERRKDQVNESQKDDDSSNEDS